MRLAVIDPGTVCGLCLFDTDRTVLTAVDLSMDDIDEQLDSWSPIDQVLVEAWMLYPWMAKKLSFHKMPGPEAIGMVRSWANRNRHVLHRTPAACRTPYLSSARKVLPKTAHATDAVALGIYWLRKNRGWVPDLALWDIRWIKKGD